VVVEPEHACGRELEQFRAARLYDPSSPQASERKELLEYLLERFSVAEILYWVERTNLVGVAARAVDRPPGLITADEAAARISAALCA